MAEFDIINDIGYIVANDDDDLMAFLQSSKFTEIMDRYQRLKVEIIYIETKCTNIYITYHT